MYKEIDCYSIEGVFQTAQNLGATVVGRRPRWMVTENGTEHTQTLHFFLSDGTEVAKWGSHHNKLVVFDSPRIWTDGFKEELDMMDLV